MASKKKPKKKKKVDKVYPDRYHRGTLYGLDPAEAKRENRRDGILIKRKLGIGTSDALPRCPTRVKQVVKAFESNGDFTHSGKDHICAECGCKRAAGYGTEHRGYGLCFCHENTFKRKGWVKMAEKVNDTHKNAIVSRHPGVYKDLGTYSAMIKDEREAGEERITLLNEIRVARGLIQEVILCAEGKGENGQVLREYVNCGSEMGKVLEPISDVTRMNLLNKMLPNVIKIVKVEEELRKDMSISPDHFKVWFGKFWERMKHLAERFDEGEIKSGRELLDCLMFEVKQVGDPRHIMSGT